MWKAQFARNKFTFEHANLKNFEVCFFQNKVTEIWILYRLVLVLFTCGFFAATYIIPHEGVIWYKNGLYFDHWLCYTAITSYALAFIITVRRYSVDRKRKTDENQKQEPQKIPFHYKVMWVLYTITGPLAIAFDGMFWIFIYHAGLYSRMAHIILSHCVIGVCTLIDIILNAIPFQFYHFYVPVVFAVCFVLFSCIYQLSGGTGLYDQIPIYTHMDWREPEQACLTGFLYMIATLFTHFGICVLCTVKQYLRTHKEEAEGPEG